MQTSSNTVTSTVVGNDEPVVSTQETPVVVTSEQVVTPPPYDDEQALLLMALARQLEFYFSPANLSRDTYLETLQQLNDGHVPISILANFTKIQTIYPLAQEHRQEAVVQAVSQYSPTLQVVHISTVTSKRVVDSSFDNTILAVGPRDVQDATATAVSVSPKSPVQNTIILREVQEHVKEEDVRELFQGLTCCPPLQHVRLDVANCWYVVILYCCIV